MHLAERLLEPCNARLCLVALVNRKTLKLTLKKTQIAVTYISNLLLPPLFRQYSIYLSFYHRVDAFYVSPHACNLSLGWLTALAGETKLIWRNLTIPFVSKRLQGESGSIPGVEQIAARDPA